jgi:hypothetical protein
MQLMSDEHKLLSAAICQDLSMENLVMLMLPPLPVTVTVK